MAWGGAAIGATSGTTSSGNALLLGGSEKIKAEYLGTLTKAPKLAVLPHGTRRGLDVAAMRTTAVRKGDSTLSTALRC